MPDGEVGATAVLKIQRATGPRHVADKVLLRPGILEEGEVAPVESEEHEVSVRILLVHNGVLGSRSAARVDDLTIPVDVDGGTQVLLIDA